MVQIIVVKKHFESEIIVRQSSQQMRSANKNNNSLSLGSLVLTREGPAPVKTNTNRSDAGARQFLRVPGFAFPQASSLKPR
jgi:hypothetical protein